MSDTSTMSKLNALPRPKETRSTVYRHILKRHGKQLKRVLYVGRLVFNITL